MRTMEEESGSAEEVDGVGERVGLLAREDVGERQSKQ
jgi:hypothetical protein